MTFETIRQPYHRMRALLAPSQTKRLVLLALTIGLSTGLMAFVFEHTLRFIRWLFFGGNPLTWADKPLEHRWWLILAPALGGLLIGPLVVKLAPEAKGHGVPEVILAVNRLDGRIRARVAWVKALASALTIGSGGSAGREGPIVQIGASLGSVLSRMAKLPPDFVKTMTAAGAAGGIAAVFNAPLAGVFFAMEVILTEFTAQAFSMVVLTAVTSSFIARALLGDHSYFYVPTYSMHQGYELLFYGFLGFLAALAAQLFIWFLYRYEDAFDRMQLRPWIIPALGGLLAGLVGFSFPHVLGTGHDVIEQVLKNELAFWMLGVLLLGKIVATSMTLGSGGSGGVFMPTLFIGAMVGGSFGALIGRFIPDIASPGAYAMVGMAACFAAATHAPMTAILILFEMTYDYEIILPVMTATVIAVLVSRALRPDTIYTLKLIRRGITLRPRVALDALAQVTVEQAMTKRVRTIKSTFTLDRVTRLIEQNPHTGFPVVNEFNDVVGLITYTELHRALEQPRQEGDPPLSAQEIMRKDPPKAVPTDPLERAMELMTHHQVDRLPVVDPDDPRKLLGIITKGDIAGTFHKLLKPSS